MSTNKTPNYNLHSWLPQDEFHVSEINENFTKLDTSLKSVSRTAAQELAALSGVALRLISGKYAGTATGSNNTKTTIDLGGKPRAVLIGTTSGYNPYTSGSYGGLATQEHPMGGLTLTETGFIAANGSPYLNESGVNYIYLALM